MHLSLCRSAGARRGVPRPVLGLLCPGPRAGQPPVPDLTGTSEGLRGAQVPLRRADGYPGAAAALRRGAEIGSQWVFWRLPVSSRQTCGAAAPPSLGTPHPRIPAPAPRQGHRHGPARHAPCGTRALRQPRLQLGFVPAQHIGVSAPGRSGTAAIGRSREAAAAIFNLPDQHPATSTRLSAAPCARCGPHLCASRHTPLPAVTGVTTPQRRHFQQRNASSCDLHSQRISATNLYSHSQPPPGAPAGVRPRSDSQSLG